jgi:hypothetical protein
MTTSIRITLPIAPGAKTCEGCWHNDNADEDEQPFCAAHRRCFDGAERLPECLASERVKIGECWRIYDADGDIYGNCESSKAAWDEVNKQGMINGARVIHVTRYRRRTCS